MIRWVPIMDEIYKQNFHLCYGGDAKKFTAFLKNKHKKIPKEDIETLSHGKGCSYAIDDYIYIWSADTDKYMAVFIHELFHHVMMCLDNCNISYKHDDQEPHAYYFEYIYEKIMEELPKLTKKGSRNANGRSGNSRNKLNRKNNTRDSQDT